MCHRPDARVWRAAPGCALSLLLALFPLLLPCAARADDLPLSAEAFEAIVEGQSFDTYSENGLYGVETFLPGHRSMWRKGDVCREGTWHAKEDQICFDYVGEDQTHCWIYVDQGGWLKAWYDGDRSSAPIRQVPTDEFVTCEGFVGV